MPSKRVEALEDVTKQNVNERLEKIFKFKDVLAYSHGSVLFSDLAIQNLLANVVENLKITVKGKFLSSMTL